LMECLGMTKSARPKRRRLVEMADRYRARRIVEQPDEPEEPEQEEDDDSADSVTPEPVQEPVRQASDVDRAVGAIRAEEEAELARRKPSDEVDEASVQGGDFGRWGDATKAAGEVGPDLASALSKATEEKYKFVQEGAASSAKGGSELWFEIEPEDQKSEIYYLGFKIREGEKGEKPSKWDIVLSKGKGLGSARTVSSKSGVKTSKLKSEAMKLAGSAKSEKPASTDKSE